MAEQAKITTLHDHDTGEAIAPRTDVKALSGEGKKWNYVGFTEDDQVGLIEGTWPCNRNLLINWYLKDPVDQRGEKTSSASADKMWLDMWHIFRASGELTDSGVAITKGDGQANGGLSQHVEGTSIFGKEVTLSFLVDGELYSGTGVVPTINDQQLSFPFGNWWTVVQPHMPVSGTPYSYVTLYFKDTNQHIVTGAKLELGSTQTLAHQENGKWVLNEIPDYETELAKCQRYYKRVAPGEMFPAVFYSTNYIDFMIPIGVPMRINPTLIGVWNISTSVVVGKTDYTLSVVSQNPSSLSYRVRATKENHGLTSGAFIEAKSDTALSADL